MRAMASETAMSLAPSSRPGRRWQCKSIIGFQVCVIFRKRDAAPEPVRPAQAENPARRRHLLARRAVAIAESFADAESERCRAEKNACRQTDMRRSPMHGAGGLQRAAAASAVGADRADADIPVQRDDGHFGAGFQVDAAPFPYPDRCARLATDHEPGVRLEGLASRSIDEALSGGDQHIPLSARHEPDIRLLSQRRRHTGAFRLRLRPRSCRCQENQCPRCQPSAEIHDLKLRIIHYRTFKAASSVKEFIANCGMHAVNMLRILQYYEINIGIKSHYLTF